MSKSGANDLKMKSERTRRSEYRKRRRTEKNELLAEMRKLLPLPDDVTSAMDTNTVLKVATNYLRVKKYLAQVQDSAEQPTLSSSSFLSQTTRPHTTDTTSLLRAMDGFAIIIDSTGTVMYVSEHVTQHLGLSPGEMIGQDILDLVHRDDYETITSQLLPGCKPRLPENIQTSSVILLEEHEQLPLNSPSRRLFYVRMQDKSRSDSCKKASASSYKMMEVTGKLILDTNIRQDGDTQTHGQTAKRQRKTGRQQQGGAAGAGGKQTDGGAEGHKERYLLVGVCKAPPPQSVVEIRGTMKGFTLGLDVNFRLVTVPESVTSLTGYEYSDMAGKNIFDFLHPEDTTQRYHKMQKVLHGLVVTAYYRFLNKVGHWMWLQCCVLLREEEKGKPWVYGVSYIISENQALTYMEEAKMICQKGKAVYKMPGPKCKEKVTCPLLLSPQEAKIQDVHMDDIFSQRQRSPAGLKIKGLSGSLMNNVYLSSECTRYQDNNHMKQNGVEHSRHSFLQDMMPLPTLSHTPSPDIYRPSHVLDVAAASTAAAASSGSSYAGSTGSNSPPISGYGSSSDVSASPKYPDINHLCPAELSSSPEVYLQSLGPQTNDGFSPDASCSSYSSSPPSGSGAYYSDDFLTSSGFTNVLNTKMRVTNINGHNGGTTMELTQQPALGNTAGYNATVSAAYTPTIPTPAIGEAAFAESAAAVLPQHAAATSPVAYDRVQITSIGSCFKITYLQPQYAAPPAPEMSTLHRRRKSAELMDDVLGTSTAIAGPDAVQLLESLHTGMST